ncbi:AAA family ATPase [Candidatus Parvarchaeota archaeon]|nr:AAA family ATPase [Candidatus Parvarchaeota archaeon]
MDFADKHSPKSFSEFVGNREVVDELKKWALEWQRGRRQKPVLIVGPTACGKTCLARLVAKEFGWELVHSSASQKRSAAQIESGFLLAASTTAMDGGRRLVLFDDVECVWQQDKGATAAIASLLQNSRQPTILTATDAYDKKVAQLKYHCTVVELKRPTAISIRKVLERIRDAQGLAADDGMLELVSRNANGDMRGAINDLQARNTEATRDREKNIFETVRGIMKARAYGEAKGAYSQSGQEHDEVKAWVGWNIPLEFDGGEQVAGEQEIEAMARAFGCLSRADMFDGRIRKRQYWVLLRYSSDLMSAGVALSKTAQTAKFVKYERPPFSYKFSAQFGAARQISRKIARVAHCNIKESAWYLPLVADAFKKSPLEVKSLYGFEDEELATICKATESTIKKLLEKAQAQENAASETKTKEDGTEAVKSLGEKEALVKKPKKTEESDNAKKIEKKTMAKLGEEGSIEPAGKKMEADAGAKAAKAIDTAARKKEKKLSDFF